MQGLRTLEGEKFERFFALIEKEAEKSDTVFFLDSGEGHDFEKDDIEGENLSGWLIPKDKTKDFEAAYIAWQDLSDWVDYYAWASWENEEDKIVVSVELLP